MSLVFTLDSSHAEEMFPVHTQSLVVQEAVEDVDGLGGRGESRGGGIGRNGGDDATRAAYSLLPIMAQVLARSDVVVNIRKLIE